MRARVDRVSAPEGLQAIIPLLDLAQPTIPFQMLSALEMPLTFLPSPALPDSRKRGRAAADIDGEHSCLQKKKRRLRLFLITSRLSPQFSHPATNIVDRGSSKIAVWAKQKAVGRNLLRKAAILNRIRLGAVSTREAVAGRGRLLVEQEKEQRQLEMARLTFKYGSIDTYTRPVHSQVQSVPPSAAVRNGSHFIISGSPTNSRSPSPTSPSPPLHRTCQETPSDSCSPNAAYALSPPRMQSAMRSYEPHLPSPLGLSNYDALDVEDDAMDPYSHLDDDEQSYPYLWSEDEDERHDSPFSPSVTTIDSHTTAITRTSQVLRTPPQTAYDDFDMLDATGSFLAVHADDVVDAVWPGLLVHPESKPPPRAPYGGASPKSSTLPGSMNNDLSSESLTSACTWSSLAALPSPLAEPARLAPASQSPNFRAVDVWGNKERRFS